MLRARWWTVTASGVGVSAAAVVAALSSRDVLPGPAPVNSAALGGVPVPAPISVGIVIAVIAAAGLWLRLPPLRWWNVGSGGAAVVASGLVAATWMQGAANPVHAATCAFAGLLTAFGCRSVPIGPGEPGVLRFRRRASRSRSGTTSGTTSRPPSLPPPAPASSTVPPATAVPPRRRNRPAPPWRRAGIDVTAAPHSAAEPAATLVAPVVVPAVAAAPPTLPVAAVIPAATRHDTTAAAAELAELHARVRTAEERAAAAEARALAAEARAAARRADADGFAVAMTAAVGAAGLVGGRWRLLDDRPPLGAGRFGVVLAVEPVDDGGIDRAEADARRHAATPLPPVAALKLLRTDTGDDAGAIDEFRVRLLREVEVLRGLDHPCIARLHDGGIDTTLGHPFLVMDLYPGGTLAAADGVGTATRLRLMADVFEALAYLHARPTPIVHRDVKPANVLLQARMRRAVLCDFGIARLHDLEMTRLTRGMSPHTPYFAAPEQIFGDVNAPVDVHAAGACAFWLLCGEPPYRAATEALSAGPAEWGRLAADGRVAPGSLADRRADLADTMPEVVALLDATLAFTPAARPTAAEVASALRAHVAPAPPPPG